ncbi:MAG: ATP-binding protein [Mariprofundales bacterium]
MINIFTEEERRNLRRFFLLRVIIGVFILTITAYFHIYSFPALQQQVLNITSIVFVFSLLLQWWLLQRNINLSYAMQLGLYWLVDLPLIACVLFATGGMSSPFGFMFALIIVASGMRDQALLVQAVTVAACALYLVAVYIYAWLYAVPMLSTATLFVLLQTSILFLVGGIMAYIARRQQNLRAETKQVLLEHRNLLELHSQLVAHMHEGIVVLDMNLDVQDSNAAAALMFTATNKKISLSSSFAELCNLPPKLENFFKNFVSNPTTQQCQVEMRHNGRVLLLSASHLPATNPLATWLISMVDVSERIALEAKLATQDKLAALGRMGAMLAHEIRNPLQTIAQAIELLPIGKQEHEELIHNVIREEIARLNRLVRETLNYVRPLQPRLAIYQLRPLIESAVRNADLANKHAIVWHCHIKELYIDADHFRLVLDNLLANALVASPQIDTINISLDWMQQPLEILTAAQKQWCLKVSDKGSGIPKAVHKHLFEPFVGGTHGGLGLGLATTWQVCQANTWQINAHNLPIGSMFKVYGIIDVEENNNVKELGQED